MVIQKLPLLKTRDIFRKLDLIVVMTVNQGKDRLTKVNGIARNIPNQKLILLEIYGIKKKT